ncbi:MAG TPA: hypothetical protein VM938_00270 [Acidimicrobiales bacterium]|nr:hypothetical protein [Acidimicrobiales bacterium]
MPSTFTTDPIGPRSVDEMLDVVYGRADALQRRRTVQRMGGGIAAVVLALVATLTVQGSNEGASVRSVDDPNGKQEEQAPDNGEGGGSPSGGEAPGSAPPGDAAGTAARSTPSSVPAKAVATTVPPVMTPPAAAIETWKTVGDAKGDATPDRWYYDITTAAMEYDPNRSTVIFTTSYRAPTGSTSGRQEREMESEFTFDDTTHSVNVRESGDQLGEVHIDDVHPCPGCTATFDAAAGRLVVTVPMSVMNDVMARESDARLQAGARIDTLVATSATVGAGNATVQADTAREDG